LSPPDAAVRKLRPSKTPSVVRGAVEYRHPAAWEKEQQRLKDELAAAQKQLADREVKINSNRQGSRRSNRSAQS